MKKIVSVLSVAALTLSAVFAADVSLNYKMAGTLYEETNEKKGGLTTKEEAKQTRTLLDLNGYADKPTGDLAFTAKNDYAGFALTLNPKVGDAYTKFAVDTYYGWLNFSNVQVTTGKWCSRYVNRLDMHSGNWEGNEFERYKPGVINGRIAQDSDNLTSVNKNKVATVDETGKVTLNAADFETRLATAVAYTLHKDEDNAMMIKGVLVDSDWGSTLRTDKDRAYDGASYSAVNGGDLGFFSGFAGEFAYRTASFDLNVALKSMYRDQLGFGAFFRTIGESSSLLFGLSAGLDLAENKVGDDKPSHNYREFAFDFRAHFDLTDELCLTTMNNISVINEQKGKDVKHEDMTSTLWNMVSLGYKANEKVFAQLTVESECSPFKIHDNGEDKNEIDGPFSQGGFKFTVTPGVVYSFNENATLTTGVALEWYNIGASPVYQDNLKGKNTYYTTSKISIPVVFKVAL